MLPLLFVSSWMDLSFLANIATVALVIASAAGVWFSWKNGQQKANSSQISEIINNWKELANSLSETVEDDDRKINLLSSERKDLLAQIATLTLEKTNLIAAHVAEVSQLKATFDFERTKWLNENQALQKKVESKNGNAPN